MVIVDEIHALAPTKAGRPPRALASSGWRSSRASRPQRIGPVGHAAAAGGGGALPRWLVGAGEPRPVAIVDAGIRKPLEVEVVIPVEDMGDLGQEIDGAVRSGPASAAMAPVRKSIWPSIYPRILELVLAHRSTIIFCNARRLAERMAARLNELARDGGRGRRRGAARARQGPPRLARPGAARRSSRTS